MTAISGSVPPTSHAAHAATAQASDDTKDKGGIAAFFSKPKNVVLTGIAATGLIAGGVAGAMRGNPMAGLGIGAGVAAAAMGATLLGNADSSQRDGWCDYSGDPDCDYPGVPYNPYPDYGYPDYGYPDYGYPDYGYTDPSYPDNSYPPYLGDGDDGGLW